MLSPQRRQGASDYINTMHNTRGWTLRAMSIDNAAERAVRPRVLHRFAFLASGSVSGFVGRFSGATSSMLPAVCSALSHARQSSFVPSGCSNRHSAMRSITACTHGPGGDSSAVRISFPCKPTWD